MISVKNEAAIKTRMNANRQYLRDFFSALRTQLRCSVGTYFDQLSTSFFRFVREQGKECTPGTIGNTPCEVSVSDHALNVQIFNVNRFVMLDVVIRQFVKEVFTLIRYPFVSASDFNAGFVPSIGALNPSSERPLLSTKIRERGLEKHRVGCNKPVRINSERLDTDIYPYGLMRFGRRSFGNEVAGKGNKPFARRSTTEGDGFDLSLSRAGEEQLEPTNFCNGEVASFEFPATTPNCNRVVTILSFEPRVARFLPLLHSSEERLEGPIQNLQRFLKGFRRNVISRNMFTEFRQLVNLIVEGYRFFSCPVAINPLLKSYVIK